MRIKLLFLTLILFLSSCSSFIDRIDGNVLTAEAIPYKTNIKTTYCKSTGEIHLTSHSDKSHNTFKAFIKTNKFSFIDKTIIWMFVQMNERPDIATPMSQISFVVNGDYYNFPNIESHDYNVFFAANYLIKKYKNKRSLLDLAVIFDKSYPNNFTITSELATFLLDNKSSILKNSTLTNIYTRGDDTLRENERIKKQNISSLIKGLSKGKEVYSLQNTLIETGGLKCNFDPNEYKNSNFKIKPQNVNALTFGIKEHNDVALITLSNQNTNFTSFNKSIYFKTLDKQQNPSLCIKQTSNLSLWMVSSQSRDPSQHLTTLISAGAFNSQTKNEVDQFLRNSRTLFLKNPTRLVFESERTISSTKDDLFRLNIPLYNSAKLGNITSYFKFKNSDSFIIDDRGNGSLSCR